MTSTIIDRLNGVVDAQAFKSPCRVATTANITLAGLQTIDGVSVVADDRVLVKNQTDATTNGIYTASTGNWTRALDMDGNTDATVGTQVYVISGTVQGGTVFTVTAWPSAGIGTGAISFSPSASSPKSRIVTSGPITVANTDQVIIMNFAAPGAVIINLCAVSARVPSDLELEIYDFSGNTLAWTVNPSGSDKIMGVNSAYSVTAAFGAQSGRSLHLKPVAALNGWVVK